MAEEGCSAEVAIIPKNDMPHHLSTISPKDVKLLARKYNIPLNLHPCALSEGHHKTFPSTYFSTCPLRIKSFNNVQTILSRPRVGKNARGKIFNETFSGMKGRKDNFFFINRRAIPDAMAWRHHDFDVNDTLSDDDFSILDVRALVERVIDLRPVHPGLVFADGLATTWDFPGCYPTSKNTEGNGKVMRSLPYGAAIPANHQLGQNTTHPLSVDQPIPDKTDHQLEVEVEDLKVIAAKEKRKSQAVKATAKKRENMRRTNDEGGSSKSKHKERRTLAKKGNVTNFDHVSSPTPLQLVASTRTVIHVLSDSDGTNDETQNAPKDQHHVSLHSPRESADESVHNFINIDDDKRKDNPSHLEPFVNLFEKPITAD
ncbi:hypothetical protein Tco_0817056 [Tanacetum coccineum]